MNLKFVNATAKDAKEILYFIKELAKYEKLEHEVFTTEEDILTNIFNSNKGTNVIFTEYDGIKVGFVLYFYTFSTFLGKCGIYVEDLYVVPEFRGMGVGKKLLQHIAQIAIKENCERIELTCLNWNVKSIGFYESIGMKPMNEWTVHRLELEQINKLANKYYVYH